MSNPDKDFDWVDRLFISIMFLITWTNINMHSERILEKIKKPVYIQCYAPSTLDGTNNTLHRIKCPEEKS